MQVGAFHTSRAAREANPPSRQPSPTILHGANTPEDPEVAASKENIRRRTAEIAALAQEIKERKAIEESLSPEQRTMLARDEMRLVAKEQLLAADKELLAVRQQRADLRRSDKLQQEESDRQITASSTTRLEELLQQVETLEIALDRPEKFTVPENVSFASKINEAQIPCYPGDRSTPYLLMHNISAQPKQRGPFVERFMARVDAFTIPGLMVGVSGAGKTRTIFEILSHRFGFFFAATSENGGLRDMENAVLDIKRSQTRDIEKNAEIALHRIAALVLVRHRLLNRMLMLHPNMTALEWLWTQLHPSSSLQDIVVSLGSNLWKECSFNDIYWAIRKTSGEFVCFIDEAQVLLNEREGQFSYYYRSKEKSPLLHTILQAMRELRVKTVIAGTGLGMADTIEVQLPWKVAAPVYVPVPVLHEFDFLDADQVQSYLQTFIDLPEDQSQLICGTLRGRPRFAATFVSRVLENPSNPIEATFSKYVDQLTTAQASNTFPESQTEASESFYAKFENIMKRDLIYVRSEQEAFELRKKLQVMILETATGRFTNVEGFSQSAELIEQGVARLTSSDPVRSVIDEPLVVHAGWNVFNPEAFLKEQIRPQSSKCSGGPENS